MPLERELREQSGEKERREERGDSGADDRENKKTYYDSIDIFPLLVITAAHQFGYEYVHRDKRPDADKDKIGDAECGVVEIKCRRCAKGSGQKTIANQRQNRGKQRARSKDVHHLLQSAHFNGQEM